MKEIKKIDKISLAKVMALFYGLIGFIIAIIIAIFTMMNIIWQKDFSGSVILVTLFNIGAGLLLGVITFLLTAVFGFIIGYLTAAVYNLLAKKIGGIKIDLDEISHNQ